MAFVHRLVVVGFVLAAMFGHMAGWRMTYDGIYWYDWETVIRLILLMGGGFAFLVYVLTWMFRGSLGRQHGA